MQTWTDGNAIFYPGKAIKIDEADAYIIKKNRDDDDTPAIEFSKAVNYPTACLQFQGIQPGDSLIIETATDRHVITEDGTYRPLRVVGTVRIYARGRGRKYILYRGLKRK